MWISIFPAKIEITRQIWQNVNKTDVYLHLLEPFIHGLLIYLLINITNTISLSGDDDDVYNYNSLETQACRINIILIETIDTLFPRGGILGYVVEEFSVVNPQ